MYCMRRLGHGAFQRQEFRGRARRRARRRERASGRRCEPCGEVEFDAPSARRYAAAGDELVMRARRRRSKEIKRIRLKLGLSQIAAARLTGGGHNAFSRYERGEAVPLPAVVNLFRLLDKHPELLEDLG